MQQNGQRHVPRDVSVEVQKAHFGEIKACQAKGKLITLSLGGAAPNVTFSGDKQAKDFAETVWDLFLGGSSKTKRFGDAVLDG